MGKIRKCPKCKSKKGYRYEYRIRGSGSESRDFKNNVIDAERVVVDDVCAYSNRCLECKGSIDYEKVNTE